MILTRTFTRKADASREVMVLLRQGWSVNTVGCRGAWTVHAWRRADGVVEVTS